MADRVHAALHVDGTTDDRFGLGLSEVRSDAQGGEESRNAATAMIVLAIDADIELALSVSSMTPTVGDILTFTLTVTNHGPAAATGVIVSELSASGYQVSMRPLDLNIGNNIAVNSPSPQ